MASPSLGAFIRAMSGPPNPAFIEKDQRAKSLNHQGLALARQGDHVGAVRLHRQALSLKLDIWGTTNITTAVSYNALGESLIHLGQLDEAEDTIKKALEIATVLQSTMDQALYRESLAMVYETRGDIVKAGQTRRSGQPEQYVCSYYEACLFIPLCSVCVG